MRNLKKFLALVLAMMMTFSLMVTVNAASKFTDVDSITDEFTEAIAVLEGLKVFEGYPDGTFGPKKDITRAEAATIVYRLATGDVAGDKAHLYKDYATFTDVTSDHWAAGYINYCANAEWIAGYGNGKFGPNDKVTGYQAAAMILRAVGYGKNNEFKGSGWQVQAANFSRTLGLLDNVNKTNYTSTLNQPATRELVAEILFQAGLIPTVTWTPMNGYQPGDNSIQGQGNSLGLAWQNFKLNVGNWTNIDKWGRPGYYWYKNNSNTAANRVATIELEADLDFNTAWKECDVAHELDFDGSRNFELFVNNYLRSTDKYRIESTDTVTNVGGQGRITEIYAYGGAEHPWEGLYNSTDKGDLNQRVVMIDTYLAKVTRVTERVLDRQGHVVTPAYLYLDVYDGHGVGPAAKAGVFFASGSAAKVNTSTHRLEDKDANWAYVAGDMVLVRGYSDPNQWENVGSLDSGDGANSYAAKAGYTKAGTAPANVVTIGESLTDITGLNHTGTQARIEEEAFENNCLLPSGANFANDVLDYDKAGSVALEVVGKAKTQKADMKTGKQTVTYWSQNKHTVDGTDYNDAMTLYLDEAGTKTGTTFAWYFDEFNNIIGIDNVPNTINYGVITSIYSAFDQGETATSGTAKAVANVLYADGSTGTITIDKFLMGATVDASWTVTRKNADGVTAMNGAAFNATTGVVGNTLDLVPVYDNSQANVMKSSGTRAGATAANQGWLHVAPVTNVNAIENGSFANGYFGVLRGNLFKFVTSGDNTVTAVEVAGDGVNGNTGVYAGHGNNTASANGAKLFKNAAYIDVDTSGVVANDTVRLDTNAVIMVRASATSTAVACYNLDTLPGDVTLASGTEVDWADTTGNGRANYVYVTGTSQGSLTYGLFYYNGGAAQWNGVDKTGTLFGWLNGEPTTLTFIGDTSFTGVRDSQSYLGHLFAVEMTNGVVTKVMVDTATGRGATLLGSANGNTISNFGPVIDTGAAGNINFTDPLGNATKFLVGTANGNPYNASTAAVYLRDSGTGATNVSYDPAYSAIAIGGVRTYYLNANSKVVGLGMGVTEETAILDYLNKSTTNDVTIVYDSNSNAIVEIYVATDPNVTPSNPSTYAAVIGSNGTTAQTSGIALTSTSIIPAAGTYITLNGTDIGNTTVKVTARVEMLTPSGYVYVGSYDWNETVTAGALGTVGKTTGVSLAVGATYRINATVYNAIIGTLPIAVGQVITPTT